MRAHLRRIALHALGTALIVYYAFKREPGQ